MQNWIQKLQSRKFLLAIGAIIAIWVTPDVANQISAILTGVIAAGYAIGEGIADSKG